MKILNNYLFLHETKLLMSQFHDFLLVFVVLNHEESKKQLPVTISNCAIQEIEGKPVEKYKTRTKQYLLKESTFSGTWITQQSLWLLVTLQMLTSMLTWMRCSRGFSPVEM